jgi:hypothetical protein
MIRRCVISDNTAAKYGGGLVRCDAAIANCLIYNNIAEYGGGMNNCNGVITSCTVADNNVTINGGGLRRCDGVVTNCIFWGNSPDQLFEGSEPSYSCFANGTGTNIDTDPLFSDSGNEDYHLLPSSPCVDTGDPGSDWNNEPVPNGGRINMGAYGNTPKAEYSRDGLAFVGFEVINKTRVGRTTFEYEMKLIIQNQNDYDVTDIEVRLVNASSAVIEVADDSTSFSIIATGQTASSDNTFMVTVDRLLLIGPSRLTWELIYYTSGDQQESLDMTMSLSLADLGVGEVAGDITGEGDVNYADLARIAEKWLWIGTPGSIDEDIAPEPNGDGRVDFLDFTLLAKNWMK